MPDPRDAAAVAAFLDEAEALDPLAQNDYIQARVSVLAELDRYAVTGPQSKADEWEFGELAPGVCRLFFAATGSYYGTYAFSDLAAACRGANIAYRMSDRGDSGSSGVQEVWTPGMAQAVEREVFADGEAALGRVELAQMIEASADLAALAERVTAYFDGVDLFGEAA
ncbi:MAG TPA: hypothetical protein VHD87_12875 [Acidimicrobiales bacterium]|nr:hypothetical protein [Acidimicrobiales bacterium]